MTKQEFHAMLSAIAEGAERLPDLPTETFSRESFYKDGINGGNVVPNHAWREILTTYNVAGVQVHDARLVAAMRVHGVSHILTFNSRDFARYSDIHVVDPHRISLL